jgi:hypothetical protein
MAIFFLTATFAKPTPAIPMCYPHLKSLIAYTPSLDYLVVARRLNDNHIGIVLGKGRNENGHQKQYQK